LGDGWTEDTDEVSEGIGHSVIRPFARYSNRVYSRISRSAFGSVANGGHASLGDGFLILPYLFISLMVSVPVSILRAGVVLFRKPKTQNQAERLDGPLALRC
jgi:hypothetical protein